MNKRTCNCCTASSRLNVCVGDCRHPEGIDAWCSGPCPCPSACPFSETESLSVLMRASIEDLLEREPELMGFLHAAATLPEASIYCYRGGAFPELVPAAYHGCGIFIVRAPAFLESRLEELAATCIEDTTVYSADLTRARTHLVWLLPELELHFPVAGYHHVLPGRGEKPCLLFLFLAGGSAMLTAHPIGEDFNAALQARCIGTDQNYRAHRVWSEEELAHAAEQAPCAEPGRLRVLEDGTLDIELEGFVPQLDDMENDEPE